MNYFNLLYEISSFSCFLIKVIISFALIKEIIYVSSYYYIIYSLVRNESNILLNLSKDSFSN
jgi:hypothetical protein